MKFFQLKIYSKTQSIDPVADMLSAMGYDNIIIEDEKDIMEMLANSDIYSWDYVDESLLGLKGKKPNVTLYVSDNSEVENIKQAFEGYDMDIMSADDEDWKDKWKEHFKPFRITEGIVVKPTWEEYKAAKGEIIIKIDPGMAFGTGTHPTTAMCVRLIDKYMKTAAGGKKGNDGASDTGAISVLDVGCGSGILSVAAAMLGAGKVTAVDIDQTAADVTRQNAALNKVQDKIDVRQGDITRGLFALNSSISQKQVPITADIVVANLVAQLIIRLKDDIKKHIRKDGIFIASGIISQKITQVEQELLKSGFQIEEILTQEDWCAVAVRIKSEKTSAD